MGCPGFRCDLISDSYFRCACLASNLYAHPDIAAGMFNGLTCRRKVVWHSVTIALVLGAAQAGHLQAPPRSSANLLQHVGVASWYGAREAGRKTASGAVFDPDRLTAAHRSLPFGTCVRVTRYDNRRSVIVLVNDRGPYKNGRLIDLSEAAASVLDMKRAGLARVELEVVHECQIEPRSPFDAVAMAGRQEIAAAGNPR